MSNPSKATVTIGLPFYNAAATLWAAIQSVYCQTFTDWVLILVDDGSRDGSFDIAARAKDPRIFVLRDGENRGLSCRLNQLAAMASTEYLARMDADDLMHPERIEKQVREMERSPAIDVLGSAAFVIDGSNRVVGIRGAGEADFRPSTVVRGSPLIHPTVFGRSAWFRENPYDGRYVRAEDRELWCRASTSDRFGRLSEPLLFYRDIPEVRKTLRSYKTERMILKKYGPERIGFAGAAVEVCKSYAKAAVVAGSGVVHLSGTIWARRNQPVRESARRAAEDVLRNVLNTSVPC
jgi:glycosyltransferase involved in cell wall biosynthesis